MASDILEGQRLYQFHAVNKVYWNYFILCIRVYSFKATPNIRRDKVLKRYLNSKIQTLT